MIPTLTTSMEKTAAAIGCSEKSRKGSTHAAHDHNVAVFFFTKSQIFTKGISDTANPAAGQHPLVRPEHHDQMGQNGADIDEGSHAKGNYGHRNGSQR